MSVRSLPAVTLSILLSLSSVAHADNGANNMFSNIDIAKIWNTVTASLSEHLSELLGIEKAPDDTMFGFRSTKNDLRDKLDADLVDVAKTLGDGRLGELKESLNSDLNEVATLSQEVSRLNDMVNTAKEPSGLSKLIAYCPTKIKPDMNKICIVQRLDQNQRGLDDARKRMDAARIQMLGILKGMGYNFSQDQLNALIYTVTGDEDIKLYTLFDSVKQLTEMLKTRMQDSNEGPEQAKKYFGMYTMLVRIVLTVQQGYLDRIEGRYLKNLAKMGGENEDKINKINDRMYADDDGQRITDAGALGSLQETLRALQLNQQAIGTYGRYLDMVATRLKSAINISQQQYLAAEVRFFTVSQSAELQAMMGQGQFNAALNMRPPPMAEFNNTQLTAKIQEFSKKLAQP